jgi:hypothetical protein
MEFDEIKEIWDAQNSRPLYVLDEKALHNRIQAKKKGILHIADSSEWSLMTINLAAGSLLLVLNPLRPGANLFMYVETIWMFATVVFIVASRIRRIKASRQFDRSIHGDLDHAISLAGYQIRLSQIVRWNLLPMGAIMILSGWEAGKFVKVGAVILVSYVLAFYVGSRELRVNGRRKQELQILKEKLENGK